MSESGNGIDLLCTEQKSFSQWYTVHRPRYGVVSFTNYCQVEDIISQTSQRKKQAMHLCQPRPGTHCVIAYSSGLLSKACSGRYYYTRQAATSAAVVQSRQFTTIRTHPVCTVHIKRNQIPFISLPITTTNTPTTTPTTTNPRTSTLETRARTRTMSTNSNSNDNNNNNNNSDDTYLSFLEKANADLEAGRSLQQQQQPQQQETKTLDVKDVDIPAPLTTVNTYYVSETDEPFEPVVLRWEGARGGSWPDFGIITLLPTHFTVK